MLFTKDILEKLERNSEIKKKYAVLGSWGQNKVVYLPTILGLFSAAGIYPIYDLSKTDSSFNTYLYICVIVAIICLIAVIFIQKDAKKKVIENIENVPVCIAKKVYGNDNAEIYYGIYTTGNKRHDLDFIESIADKIFNIDQEQDEKLKRKIKNMFGEKFAQPNSMSILLPSAFTEGENVYQGQFSFLHFSKEVKDIIENNNDKFIVIAFNDINAQLLRQTDLIQ
ncbi:hypothetical protein LZQ00_06890 [Sphingobacterium sp. SRCM116780]|uniref:hypothetical protein n=1 Tax=Sphingobacterium sp. SRCM116780 TaxID=2907623 RepID=UPI001F231532|nr:hypothetical protein [Sphingobacterium sp. SRCM116780]UIR57539.1 hypothetical protein LZQ00_06890 [Sphingobacterium sp. SRCM116780]